MLPSLIFWLPCRSEEWLIVSFLVISIQIVQHYVGLDPISLLTSVEYILDIIHRPTFQKEVFPHIFQALSNSDLLLSSLTSTIVQDFLGGPFVNSSKLAGLAVFFDVPRHVRGFRSPRSESGYPWNSDGDDSHLSRLLRTVPCSL